MSFFKPPLDRLDAALFSSAENIFGKGWLFIEWEITQRSVSQVAGLRERTPKTFFKKFRRAAIDTAASWIQKEIQKHPRQWHVHHVFSLATGGRNRRLALVHDVAHRCIHLFMKPQIEGLLVGETKKILIPVRPEMVWTSFSLPSGLEARLAALC